MPNMPERKSINFAVLLTLVKLTTSQIYAREKAGRFPKRFYPNGRTPAWYMDEVQTWLDEHPEACSGNADQSAKQLPQSNISKDERKAALSGLIRLFAERIVKNALEKQNQAKSTNEQS